MPKNTIFLFMWGYQAHFRVDVELRMNNVLKDLGVPEPGAECLLVGARVPGSKAPIPVCVEPEDGKWPLAVFDGLLEAVERQVATHPLNDMFYGDERSMREKPENIRRDSVRRAVEASLHTYDSHHSVCSFAGRVAPVGEHYVVPVIQLPKALFERFRPLRIPANDHELTGPPSLVHAAVSQVLGEAYDELLRPDPGSRLAGRSRSPDEIARRAAAEFMYTPQLCIGDTNYGGPNLFERFNLVSSLMYEGTKGTGRLLLTTLNSGAVEMLLRLAEPIPFREPRWTRKAVQMASSQTALVADCQQILGLGRIATGVDPWSTQNVFEVEFVDHYHWRLLCGDEVLLVSRYGVPSLPQDGLPLRGAIDTFRRLFPSTDTADAQRFEELCDTAVAQRHGSMLLVAEDAEAEASRLAGQGTKIEPTTLTPELYRRVSGIDGTVIVDSKCVCHAIGVILDGLAQQECTPSRGSRYNSAIRYVGASTRARLAVVVSDDHTVDVIPLLPPLIKLSSIEAAIATLEKASHKDYHRAINWLDKHRIYLDEPQCSRINSALARIRSEPLEVGELRIQWREFRPNPALDDSFFDKGSA